MSKTWSVDGGSHNRSLLVTPHLQMAIVKSKSELLFRLPYKPMSKPSHRASDRTHLCEVVIQKIQHPNIVSVGDLW